MFDPTDSVPSVHDLYGDSGVMPLGFDEGFDAFASSQRSISEEELDQLWVEEMERRDRERKPFDVHISAHDRPGKMIRVALLHAGGQRHAEKLAEDYFGDSAREIRYTVTPAPERRAYVVNFFEPDAQGDFGHRGIWKTIGRVDALNLDEAKSKARAAYGEYPDARYQVFEADPLVKLNRSPVRLRSINDTRRRSA